MASIPANYETVRPAKEDSREHSGWMIKSILSSLVFLIVFFNQADFGGQSAEQFSVHWEIYARLLICAASGLAAILLMHQVLGPYLKMPGLLISGFLLWSLILIPTSVDKSYSTATLVSLIAVAAMVPAAIKTLGQRQFMNMIGLGLVTYLVGSWIAYLFIPEIGVFYEQVSMTDVYARMGGLGHPNELGLYSAFTFVLFAGLHAKGQMKLQFVLPIMALAAATLVTSYSRTSLILATVGLAVVYRDRLLTRQFVLTAMVGVLLLIPIVGYQFASGTIDWTLEDTAMSLSKSGTADELSTATGRTEIWSYAIERIGEKPLTGFGYGTMRFVMDEHSFHCHNTFLNFSLSTGVVGGLFFLTMCGYLLTMAWQDPRPEIDGLVAIIIIGGFVEGALLSPAPTCQLLVFMSAILWRQLTVENPQQHRNLSAASA